MVEQRAAAALGVALAIAVLGGVSGCFKLTGAVGPPVRPSPSYRLPNPVVAVVAHCPELVCTQADVPSCEFETVETAEAQPFVERVRCARSPFGTDCEERRAPGVHDTPDQVLRFRCAGNPVECWMTGGNATWETTLDASVAGGKPVSYPCRRARPGPEPARHPVPGPNTV